MGRMSMSQKVSRRDFVRVGTGIVAAGASPAFGQGPAVRSATTTRPVVIASANGNRFKNGGTRTAVEEAFLRMTRGEDVLDAVIAGVNICELDPEDDSVGYGGLPNALGVVQLDASCMHGPRRRAGAVAALEGIRTPSLVARAVADLTDHHLLVGHGAQEFARGLGFKVEDDLNTDNSRKLWLEWKRRTDPEHYLDPLKREEAGRKVGQQMMDEGLIDPQHYYGTINCNGVNAKGEVCGVTTTSGLAWKIPGRVGDSPILGAGLWLDGDVGAAGSTGRGEANLFNLSSHLIVEEMRRGRHPKDAGMEALRRIRANTVEKRLLNSKGNPNFNVNFYVVNRRGEFAGVSLYGGKNRDFAVCTEQGPQTLPCDGLLAESDAEARPEPKATP
jgi:N4-(beta-N-acetylglucosaminyl)-L-asparaginase